MLYRVYFTDGGLSKTGLSPTWKSLLTAVENGTDKSGSAPTIVEIGGGYYTFNIDYGVAPWDDKTKDLVGEIDGGSSLVTSDRYKPVVITLRGMALAKIAHKGVQNKGTGDVDIYDVDGTTKAFKVDMTNEATEKIRVITTPS